MCRLYGLKRGVSKVTELMIDATIAHEDLSYMDCTAGYNQIQMALRD